MLTVAINQSAVGIVTGSDTFLAAFDLPLLDAEVRSDELEARLVEAIRGKAARLCLESPVGLRQLADLRAAGRRMGWPTRLVTATEWRQGLALADFPEAASRRARALFPEADLPDSACGRASALLLAHYVIAGRSKRTLMLPGRVSRAVRARAREHGRLW